MAKLFERFKSHRFFILLLSSILLGGLVGYFLGDRAIVLKPLGDIFINLLFTVVVPLVFFSVAASIAGMSGLKRLGKILASMLAVFLFASAIAAIYMIVIVKIFPPAQGVTLNLSVPGNVQSISIGEQLVGIFTVSEFQKLLSPNNMLALIFFSILVGLATLTAGEKGKLFAAFLQAGTEVFMKVISFIMYYAPIGFFAYFAVMVAELGPKLMENYARAMLIYYPASLIYFVFAFTFFAYLADKKTGVKTYWKNAWTPMITALATCSSAASIPANLQATKQIGVPPDVYETVVPLGAIVHKDGTVLGAVVKIAFLFGIFHMNFSGPHVLLMALFVAILVGTVMGAIPSGGLLGEILILSLYGFPPQALMIIGAISVLIDPLATMLNVIGNTVCSMLVARLVSVFKSDNPSPPVGEGAEGG